MLVIDQSQHQIQGKIHKTLRREFEEFSSIVNAKTVISAQYQAVYEFRRKLKNQNNHYFQLHIDIPLDLENIFCQFSTKLHGERHLRTNRALLQEILEQNKKLKESNCKIIYTEDHKKLQLQVFWDVQPLSSLLQPGYNLILNTLCHKLEWFELFLNKVTSQPKKLGKEVREFLNKHINKFKQQIMNEIKSRPKNLSYEDKCRRVLSLKSPNPSVQCDPPQNNSIKIQNLLFNKAQTTESKQQQTKNKIVKQIQFLNKKIDETWNQPSSSYGLILRLNAVYKIQKLSLNRDVGIFMQNNDHSPSIQGDQAITGTIMEKTVSYLGNESSSIQECFHTEVAILKYMRNFQSSNIASYYIQKLQKNQTVRSFYLDEYPTTLEEVSCNFDKMFKIMKFLSFGLKSLHSMKIIHRDLKPQNVMINHNFVPKIIDFGSAWIRNIKNHKEMKICDKLRTSIPYNLRKCSQGLSREEFQHHPYFDVYAFGKIMSKKIWETLDKHKNQYVFQSALRINLRWIEQKCSSQYSWNRVSPEQLYLFLKNLEKFIQMIKKK